jgi:hypothetical protein
LLDQVSNQLTSLAPGECLSAVRLKSRGHGMGTNLAPAHFAKYLWVDQNKKRSTRLVRMQPVRRSPSSPFGD